MSARMDAAAEHLRLEAKRLRGLVETKRRDLGHVDAGRQMLIDEITSLETQVSIMHEAADRLADN